VLFCILVKQREGVGLKIAVFGDIHGHWCSLRDAVASIGEKTRLDLVLQCGDAQPFRDETDLSYMRCPKKYRELGDFHEFVSGEETLGVKTLFIGGNHEPWNFLDEHPSGGELAPNIEFLGRVGMRSVEGIRIAGVSGIHSKLHFEQPRLKPPYPPSQSKRVTYYNEDDISDALDMKSCDILLLHEWPDVMNNAREESWPRSWGSVGSPHLSWVVETLNPRFVFCGHMHRAALTRCGFIEIVCLSDLHRDAETSCVLLDTESWKCEWPLNRGLK
jgi:Icc-related predicted phosphoesterase